MNESSSGVPFDAERFSSGKNEHLETLDRKEISNDSLLESLRRDALVGSSKSSTLLDIASTCSMLKNDCSGTVTTAVYEAGGETTIVDGRTGTATVVEGAEVVRTVAVSYATPILHHVLLQGSPLIYSTVSTVPSRTSPSCPQEIRETVEESSESTLDSLEKRLKDEKELTTSSSKDVSSSSSGKGTSPCVSTEVSSIPVWVITSQSVLTPSSSSISTSSSCITSSSSLLKHPITSISDGKFSNLVVSPSLSCQGNCVISSQTCFVASSTLNSLGTQNSKKASGARNDDELTSLSWLQDSSFLLGTALSPIKTASPSADGLPANENKILSSLSHCTSPKIEPIVDEQLDGSPEKPCSESRQNGVVAKEFKEASPTSDFGDESLDFDEPGELVINDEAPRPRSPLPKPPSVPYNPLLHVKTKPPYSFSCLIFMAIEESQTKALPVKDIYSWILSHFPYYRSAPTGWKNSVRHNLSLNKCFRKVEKAPNLGKGSLWMVDQLFRPNLLQALSKIPLHPYSNVDRVYMIPNKAVLSPRSACSKVTENSVPLPGLVIRREGGLQSACSCSDSGNSDSADEVTLPKKEEMPPLKAFASPLKETNGSRLNDTAGLVPNPDLFPLLAKRMEADLSSNKHKQSLCSGPSTLENKSNLRQVESKMGLRIGSCIKAQNGDCLGELSNDKMSGSSHYIKQVVFSGSSEKEEKQTDFLGHPPIKVESEDVDAAAAMLILKHGPQILGSDKVSRRVSILQSSCSQMPYFNKRKQKHSELVDPDMMLISSSPSLDHEYISLGDRKISPSLNCYKVSEGSPHSSMRNCSNANRKLSVSPREDEMIAHDLKGNSISEFTEFRETRGKADALLNLASIATSLALRQMNGESSVSDGKEGEDRLSPSPGSHPKGRQISPKTGNKRKAFQPKRSLKRNKKTQDPYVNNLIPFSRKKDLCYQNNNNLKLNKFSNNASLKKNASTNNNNNNNNNNYVINEQYFSKTYLSGEKSSSLKVKKVIKVVETNS